MKKILAVFFLFFFIFQAHHVFAQAQGAAGGIQSKAACTKVGNAPDDQKPAACATGGNGIRPEAPPAEGDLRGAIQEKFGISMNGYDRQRMQWAWEKLWDVSNTNFVELVRGSVIEVTSTSNSHQVGCPGAAVAVYLGPFNDEYTFKQAFIHELGHVIANCSTKQTANWNAYLKAHVAEGGVSYYGGHAESCTGSDSISEDFAEMIAFYLNPGYAVSIVRCNQAGEKVDMASQFPLHFQVAQAILGNY